VYTSDYAPWRLVTFFGFNDKKQALDFEKYLKSHSGRAFAEKRFW
jgi:predicted GIY-YIG superfamily endonuclease